MKNYITNIELINEHIIITYNNKYIKKVSYNKNNRDEIIANLELNKNNLKTERKHLKKFKNYLYLLSFFKISMTILVYLITNNLITRTLITIWCLEICTFCFYLIKESQKDKLSIDTLLNILFTKCILSCFIGISFTTYYTKHLFLYQLFSINFPASSIL